MSQSSPREGLAALERRFGALSEPLVSADFSVEFLRWVGKALGWEEVLALRCAVIFGEAGTGKTTEFRSRASVLAATGRTAFFLPVEAVAERGVAPSLDLLAAETLARWRADTGTEAWFLLDSVDESKLHGKTLDSVARAFERELGSSALRRAHILVSSRASDWRSSDEDVLAKLARFLGPEDATEHPRLLLLLPLDQSQVALLAEHYGVGDLDALLTAVRASNAWSFLERPQDVRWLVRYWLANGRLGTHRELISYNVDERLRERDDRLSHLSRDDARRLAGKLSLAGVLTRSASFLLPGEIDPKATDALDARELLPECNGPEIRDLLARGLFDEATYGRVRIHHRSVTDFLAAEHIERMRRGKLSRSTVEALLFRQIAGRVVVPRHLAAVGAWLALGDDAIRRRMIAHAPEHLIDEGDPAGLSAADRRTTLLAYAARFGDRKHVFHHFDSFGLRRFAAPELADTMRELLSSTSEPDHLRAMLFRMIAEGAIGALAADALACSLSSAATPSLRTEAIRAVAKAGGDSDRSQLASLAGMPAARNADVLVALLRALGPKYLPIPQIVQCLLTVVRPAHTTTTIDTLGKELVASCSLLQRSELLAALVAALQSDHSKPGDVSHEARVWLSEYLAEAALGVIADGPPFPSSLPAALKLLRAVCELPGNFMGHRIERFFHDHAPLRREAFRAALAEMAPSGSHSSVTSPLSARHLSSDDLDWLRADCIDRRGARERVFEFDCLVRHLPATMLPPDKAAFLDDVVSESRARHGDDALGTHLRRMRMRSPMEAPFQLRWHKHLHHARELKEKQTHEINHRRLREALPLIRSGRHANALVHLLERCSSSAATARHDALSVANVLTVYDSDIAHAAVEGFRTWWKKADIGIGSTDLGRSTIVLGLTGVRLDVEGGLDLLTLSDDLLARAVLFASQELNGFPDWVASIALHKPSIVRDVFGEALRVDYAAQSDTPRFGLLRYKLATAPMEVRRACAPLLRDLILDRDPGGCEALAATLDVLLATEALGPADLAGLATTRLDACGDDYKRFGIWWRALLTCDAATAVARLARARELSEASARLLSEACAGLSERLERATRSSSPLRRDPGLMAQLTRLVPPGRTEHGRDLRDSLIGWLAEVPGGATVCALDTLASDPALSAQRDWLRHIADTRAASDAAAMQMSHEEAARFLRNEMRRPETAADLFLLALNRLEDICDDVERGDFSVRALYNPPPPRVREEHFQNFLARELHYRRDDQYVVVREPEIIRKKRPDIRLFDARCGGPVTLELKVAESWTGPELENALSAQLVGMYMRSNSSRFGVLVLCSSGRTKTWEAGSRSAGFREFVEYLRTQCKEIVRLNAGVEGLEVVGIDFH